MVCYLSLKRAFCHREARSFWRRLVNRSAVAPRRLRAGCNGFLRPESHFPSSRTTCKHLNTNSATITKVKAPMLCFALLSTPTSSTQESVDLTPPAARSPVCSRIVRCVWIYRGVIGSLLRTLWLGGASGNSSVNVTAESRCRINTEINYSVYRLHRLKIYIFIYILLSVPYDLDTYFWLFLKILTKCNQYWQNICNYM